MSQNGKLMPNLDEKTTKVLNLTVLQRIDPFVEEILITAAHVTFYEFNIDTSQWVCYHRYVCVWVKRAEMFWLNLVLRLWVFAILISDEFSSAESKGCRGFTFCREKVRALMGGLRISSFCVCVCFFLSFHVELKIVGYLEPSRV